MSIKVPGRSEAEGSDPAGLPLVPTCALAAVSTVLSFSELGLSGM